MNKREAIQAMLDGKTIKGQGSGKYTMDDDGLMLRDGIQTNWNHLMDRGWQVFDLPKEYKVEFYCNVQSDGMHAVYRTRERADYHALSNRVACIRIGDIAEHGQGIDMELSGGIKVATN